MFNGVLRYFSVQDIVLNLFFFAALGLCWLAPRFGTGFFRAIEKRGAVLATNRRQSFLFIALLPAVLRLSLLWLAPVPVPHTHDEFSYLLQGDTFAHGRLTNPPHPMWVFLDTIHVNQHPTYMSKYPPAQGMVLALGELLGSPWVGVVISISILSMAALWMLQGWLPPRWALLGSILVVLRLGVFSYWMNGYWGGAIPATGGALVAGALPRILRSWRPRDALLLGFGAALLMNSRPLEGLIFCLPVAVVLSRFVARRAPPLRIKLARFFVPLGLVLTASGIFIGYYNWRGTGSPFLMPYVVNERAYLSTPTLLWQKIRPPIPFMNPQFNSFYNGWLREQWYEGRPDSVRHTVKRVSLDVAKFTRFYLWPELCVPLLCLPWILRKGRMRLLAAQAVICFAGFLCVAYFQPHYAAPLTAGVFALVVQGIRYLRRYEWNSRPVGLALSRVVVVFAVVLSPFHPHSVSFGSAEVNGIAVRSRIEAQLERTPGNHLVIVRYSPQHDPLAEWVYNKAEIDRAKVVWAREIPGIDPAPLLKYFQGRQVWIVTADTFPPQLARYSQ